MGPFLRSEGNIDAADPVPHRGLREEVGCREVVLARLVELRVEASVFRPSRQVATRDREAQRRGMDVGAPLRRRVVRQRDLAQLDEVRILHVTRLGALDVATAAACWASVAFGSLRPWQFPWPPPGTDLSAAGPAAARPDGTAEQTACRVAAVATTRRV